MAPTGKCRVVLVNSFLGNDYRIQMQRSAEAASKHEPYSKVVDFSILNTENTPEAQRAGVGNLFAQGVDAILLNAVDNTSMNDIVEKACDQGVKVVTFDITAKPGACQKSIDFGFYNWAFDAGSWSGLVLGVKDKPINVIMDKGLHRVFRSPTIFTRPVWTDWPKQPVARKRTSRSLVSTMASLQKVCRNRSSLLSWAANPDVHIDYVHTQGYCTTVVSAFKNAGLDYLPPMYCQGYNANAVLCTEEGVDRYVQLDTFAGSIGALDTAYRMFMGEEVAGQIAWPTNMGVTKAGFEFEPKTPGAQFQMLDVGVNAFPDLPPGFGPLYNWPGPMCKSPLKKLRARSSTPSIRSD